jgi:Mg2+-importing ATPase
MKDPMTPAALTDIESGLSSAYVHSHHRQKNRAYNGDFFIGYKVLVNQMRSIFFVLLLISAVLSFYLGNRTDAYIFVILNALNVLIGFAQEFKASKASKTLEKMIKHRVTVVRDGKKVTIDHDSVIEGDIVLPIHGNVLVADLYVRECHDAFIDESLLTGESLPRSIVAGDMVYAGTSVVGGRFIGQVTAAGEESSLMQYGKALKKVQKDNDFARFVKKVSVYILFITLVCLALIAIYAVVIEGKYTSTTFILFAISMLIGVVPESLSLIITLMLTREAITLSREGVIVKSLPALQQLGSIRYLLTDKTGTLTENAIRLVDTHEIKGLQSAISLISAADYERTPMDAAFDDALRAKVTSEISADTAIYDLVPKKPIVTPFTNIAGYAVFDFGDIVIRRGQFHSVLAASTGLSEGERATLEGLYTETESKGLRILAFASSLKASDHDGIFLFNGFAVFEDPLKVDAADSYNAAEELGIKVKILTGDSVLVSKYIARQLDHGLSDANVEELGKDIEIPTYSEREIEENRVYARCMPEQKLELINRHIPYGAVGFLGEGINDALALKRADVGIVVTNASDIGRQSADILLTEKSLNPIIKAIKLSRKAYAHISTYLLCTLTGNVGTLISITAVAMFWTDLPMLPIQILLNNLLTDVPLIFLITDRLAKEQYDKPIENIASNFFRTIFIFGLISSVFDIIYFYMFKDLPLEVLRTGWFIFSVTCELALVFSLRTKLSMFKGPRMSKPLTAAMILSGLAAFLLMYVPELNAKLALVAIDGPHIAMILGLTVAYMFVNEIYKHLVAKRVR